MNVKLQLLIVYLFYLYNLRSLFRTSSLYGQRVGHGRESFLKEAVDQTVPGNAGKACKAAGNDNKAEMALPTAVVPGVAFVPAAFIDDFKVLGLQILANNS